MIIKKEGIKKMVKKIRERKKMRKIFSNLFLILSQLISIFIFIIPILLIISSIPVQAADSSSVGISAGSFNSGNFIFIITLLLISGFICIISNIKKSKAIKKIQKYKEGKKAPQPAEQIYPDYAFHNAKNYINFSVNDVDVESALVAQPVEHLPVKQESIQTSGFEPYSENPGQGACNFGKLFLILSQLISIFMFIIPILLIISSIPVQAADPGHSAPAISAGTFEADNYIFPYTFPAWLSLNNGIIINAANSFSVANSTNVVHLFINDSAGRIGIGGIRMRMKNQKKDVNSSEK